MEQPHNFEKRIASAKRAREQAEAELRYFFYLDSLQVEEVSLGFDAPFSLDKLYCMRAG